MAASAIKLIIFVTALSAMTLTIVFNIDHTNFDIEKSDSNIDAKNKEIIAMPFKRVNRFLNEDPKQMNLRAADHCNKNNEICNLQGNNSTTCCDNKCMDLSNDKKNCGICKKKCMYTQTCCRGECVDVMYDKRHCGECNHRCMAGGFCMYGLCDYA